MRNPRLRSVRVPTVLFVLGTVLAGCSATPAPSFSALFQSMKPQDDANAAATPEPAFECPSIQVRQGAGTYSVSARPGDSSALDLRYQVSIAETARECRLVAGTVTMKIGVQGRLVVGPAGAPSKAELPLRIAVVQEGVSPKTIVSKLERVSVSIPDGAPHVLFTHVDDGVSFPMPPGNAIDYYVIYVGFDPLGAREQRRPAPRRATKQRQS